MSAISSPFRKGRARLATVVAAVTLAMVVSVTAVSAKVYLTTDQGLELAFPGATIERETVFLSEEQKVAAEKRADAKIPSLMVTRYTADINGVVVGYAYFDAHRVRTKPETIMVALHTDGSVKRVEVLSFEEPEDYLLKDIWYDQFDAKSLSDPLRPKQDIPMVTGATITVQKTTQAVRRVLALHEQLEAQPDASSAAPAPQE